MARNGSGTFSLTATMATSGQVASSTTVNSIMDDVADGLTDSINVDGTKAFAQNQPMGTKKFTGLGDGTSRTDSIALGQVQDDKINWVDAGGTADAITATYSPAITALVDGQLCYVRALGANTSVAPTFAPNGLTARTIKKYGATSLVVGDIAGNKHELILRYHLASTVWELLNPAGDASVGAANTFTAAQSIIVSDAATVTPSTVLTTGHRTSGTAGVAFGSQWVANLENASDTVVAAGTYGVEWVVATNAIEESRWSWKTYKAGVNAVRGYLGYGLYMGAEADKGVGSINGTQVYVGGNRVAAKKFKTDNETINNDAGTTIDTDLRFTPTANTTYAFKFHVFYESAAAAGLRFALNIPASPTKLSVMYSYMPTNVGVTPSGSLNLFHGKWISEAQAETDVEITGGTPTTGGHIIIDGMIQNGSTASGVTFMWAQKTSDAGDTTVLKGSWVEWTEQP